MGARRRRRSVEGRGLTLTEPPDVASVRMTSPEDVVSKQRRTPPERDWNDGVQLV